MRGAPARGIQELAGHQDIGTTHRYMPLTPAALDVAIRLLDSPPVSPGRGAGGGGDRRRLTQVLCVEKEGWGG